MTPKSQMVKVKKIAHDKFKGTFLMFFEIDKKEDGFLAQEIYRAIVHTYCSESAFGYNDGFEEILEFDYPCKSEIVLGFEKETGRSFYSSKHINKLAETERDSVVTQHQIKNLKS